MRCPNPYWFVLLSAIFPVLFFSCKKELTVIYPEVARAEGQRLKDSVYYYYKLYSLWSDTVIPEQHTLFSFTDTYDSPLNVLEAMRRTTPFHAGYRTNIDRFSYLEDITGQDSPDHQLNSSHGFGLYLAIGAVNQQEAYPVVYYAAGDSPAAMAGIRRSDVILGIDSDQDLRIPVSCASGSCQVLDEKVRQAVQNKLLAAMQRNRIQLRVRRADNSESELTILSKSYAVNPVIKDQVFSYPVKSIGYLALSSFEQVVEGEINRHRLDRVFERFEQRQVSELIFDLRYNTGGYVRTVEYIANKVIRIGADGSLMYKYILNAYLSKHPEIQRHAFQDIYFKRTNTLNLNTVYFIVTNKTASASELLINVLRPYMNVVIIAEHMGTYGKPVGFFRQDIMGQNALWVASFKLANARGETDYWDGIGADQGNIKDDIFRDFGDTEESMLGAVLNRALGQAKEIRVAGRVVKVAYPEKYKIEEINTVRQQAMLR